MPDILIKSYKVETHYLRFPKKINLLWQIHGKYTRKKIKIAF